MTRAVWKNAVPLSFSRATGTPPGCSYTAKDVNDDEGCLGKRGALEFFASERSAARLLLHYSGNTRSLAISVLS
jgi:hypothetical protein